MNENAAKKKNYRRMLGIKWYEQWEKTRYLSRIFFEIAKKIHWIKNCPLCSNKLKSEKKHRHPPSFAWIWSIPPVLETLEQTIWWLYAVKCKQFRLITCISHWSISLEEIKREGLWYFEMTTTWSSLQKKQQLHYWEVYWEGAIKQYILEANVLYLGVFFLFSRLSSRHRQISVCLGSLFWSN